MNERPLLTGIGVIAPTGLDAGRHWRATLAGHLRVVPIDGLDPARYPCTLGGRVEGFDPRERVDGRLIVQTDRWSQLALAAADQALEDAGYDPTDHEPYDTGVVMGSDYGGNEFGQREIQALWSRGPRAVGAYQSIAWFYAASTGQLSIRHGTKGPSGVVASGGAAGLDCIAQARRMIRRGTPVVLTGGTEAPLSPYAMACQAALAGRFSTATDPRSGYKPFDRATTGAVPGEGGAILVLESPASARRRPARRVYAEIAGHAATHDGTSPTDRPQDASGLTRAITGALVDADIEPAEVDLVIADAAGDRAMDALEAEALRTVFGSAAPTDPSVGAFAGTGNGNGNGAGGGVPVTAPQGLTGRLASGAGALSVATAALAIADQVAPPVGNLDDPDPAFGLDLVHREPRQLRIDTVLVLARGHGGFNSALVLSRPPTDVGGPVPSKE